jgi:type IV pilus assembly protein PilC
MARLFAYKARTLQGKQVDGFLEAESDSAVVKSLRDKHIFVVDVRPAVGKEREVSLAGLFRKRVSQQELALLCRQFAAMTAAGLPIFQALNILTIQAENPYFEKILKKVVEHVEGGMSLAEAFSLFPRVFPPVFTSMVEAGEVSGTLEEVLERLAAHFEKEHEIREKVRSALTYPTVVLVIAALAVGVLMTFVIPTFVRILGDLNVPLPLPTRVLLGTSLFLKEFWYLVIVALVLVITGLRYFFGATVKGKEIWDGFVLRLPVVGMLVRKVIVARFARTLSTMVRSGVPILTALGVVQRTAGNVVIAKAIERTTEKVSEGGTIAGLLEESGVFPPMVTRMIAVGEETGTLEELLEKVGAFYDRDVSAAVERLAPTIEPFLILGLGVIIGSIILSVLLPMFSIYGEIQ